MQHGAIQRQVSDQSLQLTVLVLQLLEPPDFRHAQADELLLPAVKGRLRAPIFRQTSSTVAPFSACRRAKAICSFVKRLRSMAFTLSQGSRCQKVCARRGPVCRFSILLKLEQKIFILQLSYLNFCLVCNHGSQYKAI